MVELPLRVQQVTYTSFKRPAAISENGYAAEFTYNSAGDRVKMQLQNDGATELTRYYIGGNYEQDVTSAGTTERLYLGGDAYSAPAVYIKDGNNWKIHYICRDYQGCITHLTDSAGRVVQELEYDAWGRLRDPQTMEIYEPGSEPDLLLGRGYTGHEHLPQFGLINMNARLYDPAVGRFLSPDPYIQDPMNSQNYNRYSYCLNNPLKYTDPSGEAYKWDELIGAYKDELGHVISSSDMWLYENGLAGNGFTDSFGGGAGGWDLSGTNGYWTPGYYYYNSQTNQLRFLDRGGTVNGAWLRTLNLNQRDRYTFEGGLDNDFLNRTNTTLGVGVLAYTGLEKLTSNSKWWIDAKGQVRSTDLLQRGANGKYVRGVQGLRNSQAAAAKAAGIYGVAGRVVGVAGGFITGIQYLNGDISGTEAAVDLFFTGIGFTGWGAPVSLLYFGGKFAYETVSGDTLFDKPVK